MVAIVKTWEAEQNYECHQVEMNAEEFSQLCQFLRNLSPAEFEQLDSSTTLELTIYQDILNESNNPSFGLQDRLWLWGCGLISCAFMMIIFAGVFQILSWIVKGN